MGSRTQEYHLADVLSAQHDELYQDAARRELVALRLGHCSLSGGVVQQDGIVDPAGHAVFYRSPAGRAMEAEAFFDAACHCDRAGGGLDCHLENVHCFLSMAGGGN
jgi:hypothetical protein